MTSHRIRTLLFAVVGTASLVGVSAPATAVAPAPAVSTHASVSYHHWSTAGQFAAGSFAGTVAVNGSVTFGHAVGRTSYDDGGFGYPTRTFDYATWTSPRFAPGFGLTELVSSWNAATPAGTWLQVQMRGHTTSGSLSGWYTMGRWASGDGTIHRTSVPGQSDANGAVYIDTFFAAKGRSLRDYQLKVTLLRLPGTRAVPVLRSVGAVASALPADKKVPVSPLGGAEGVTLAVPRYSQDVHKGEYPKFDGGGEAWCSPTSTEMVVEYYGRRPGARQLAWVNPRYADPSVDYAARYTFDYNYSGTGNWPFNTAYAGSYGLQAFVTQLRSLTEAEQFIKAGIPLTVSVSFKASELDGAGYSTNGHLMDIVGFAANGDVVVNDPVSPNDRGVRKTYDRTQFENVWIPTSRSGGVAYVVHDGAHPLPRNVAGVPNW